MKFLCLDIPQPGASLEKYPPHMHEETRHAWTLYTAASCATSISVRTARASLSLPRPTRLRLPEQH